MCSISHLENFPWEYRGIHLGARIDLVVDFACREEPRDFAVRYIIGLFLADHGHAICDFQTRFET